jgi:hypothetical protein
MTSTRPTEPGGQNRASRSERSELDPGGRKPYAAPELVEYGTVAKLTQTGGATVVDFVGMMGMKLL